MKRIISTVLFILFACSVILTTVFFVPKYGTYRDGNTKEIAANGYYRVWDLTAEVESSSGTFVYSDGSSSSSKEIDLTIDYGQWCMITFAECAVLLLPAAVLYKEIKKPRR
jgi:hypothetical protein